MLPVRKTSLRCCRLCRTFIILQILAPVYLTDFKIISKTFKPLVLVLQH